MIRQAHPGPGVEAYRTFGQKRRDAESFSREDNWSYPVLIDDVEGSTHQVYGGLADPTYLIDADGRVSFYCMWTHAPTLHSALVELLRQNTRGVAMGGVHKRPHMAASITDGWRGLRRGLPRSFVELEVAAPTVATMTFAGHLAKPLLAPITLRSRPLPPTAKFGLVAAAAISAAAGLAIAKNKLASANGRKRYEGRAMKLRSISEQVMVITGATSGIGLTTARMAAEQGAQVALIARNEDELVRLENEINQNGGRAIHYAADVADERSLRDATKKTINEFGRIDAWVNNAGVAIYGKLADVSEEDSRKMFDTNFWGVVAGSRVAIEHLRANGGALINVGSEVSDSPVPLIGMYAASKHAVKGFTDTLRMELESEKLPISVTLIKPTAIATPFSENAKNYMSFEPQVPQPVFAPDLVAEAIIYCAQHPTRDFFVGETAAVNSAMATYAPRLHDKLMESMAESMQNSGEPSTMNRRDGLHATNSQLRERFSSDRFVMEASVYQKAKMHPLITAGLLAGGGIAIATYLGKRMMKTDGYEKKLLNEGRNFMQDNEMNIAEDMEVVGSDGEHVGTVDKVEGDQIKLTKNDRSAEGQHHMISMDTVDSVTDNRVTLNQTATDTKASWQAA